MIHRLHFILTITLFLILKPLTTSGQELRFFAFGGWNHANFKLWVKPKFDISKFNTLIIAEILDERNRRSNMAKNVHDKLSNEVFLIPDVNLLTRDVTESLLKELEFQSTGLVDSKFVQRLGQFYSSGVLMVGRIQQRKFESQVVRNSNYIVNNCRTKYRKARYSLSFSFKFIDIRTTALLYTNVIDVSISEKTRSECSPPKISEATLYSRCLDKLGEEFRKLLTLHQESIKVEFQVHRKFNDRLKRAITYMRVGEWEQGYAMLKAIAKDQTHTKALSCALYNLAAFELHTKREHLAFQNAKRSYLLNRRNAASLKIVNRFQ